MKAGRPGVYAVVVGVAVIAGALLYGGRADDEAPRAPSSTASPPLREAGREPARATTAQVGQAPAQRIRSPVAAAHADVESWLASLPPDQQQRARAFVARYGPAYRIGSEAEFQWLLAHGFPSLEEVGRFDPAMLGACASHGCRNGKLSALGADHSMNELEKILVRAYPDAALPEDYLGSLAGEDRAEFMASLVAAQGYIRNARDNGSVLFASHLRIRLGRMLGSDIEVDGAEAFIAACGDPRMNAGNAAAARAALGIMDSLPGSTGVCGYAPGRPPFPQ